MKTRIPAILRITLLLAGALALNGCNGGSDDEPAAAAADAQKGGDNASASGSTTSASSASTTTSSSSNPPPRSARKVIDPGFSSSRDMANPSSANLTGTWGWQYSGLYKLRQSGSSLQGTYIEPGDPNVIGIIAGSIQGARIEMDVMVTHKDNPAANFTAHKSGQIHSSNYITLVVTGGPKFLGNVQEWYKQ